MPKSLASIFLNSRTKKLVKDDKIFPEIVDKRALPLEDGVEISQNVQNVEGEFEMRIDEWISERKDNVFHLPKVMWWRGDVFRPFRSVVSLVQKLINRVCLIEERLERVPVENHLVSDGAGSFFFLILRVLLAKAV